MGKKKHLYPETDQIVTCIVRVCCLNQMNTNASKMYKLTVCDIKGFQKQFIQSDECKCILWIISETLMKNCSTQHYKNTEL